MSELSQLKFPAIYSQLAKDFIDTITHGSAIDFSISKGLELLNIPANILQDPDARLNGDQISLLLTLGQMLAKKDKPFSLQIVEHFKEDTLGMLGLAIINADDAEQGLNVFQKYAELYIPGFDFSLNYDEKNLDIEILPLVNFKKIEAILVELIFGAFDFYTKRAGLESEGEYYFSHDISANQNQLDEYYGCPVHSLAPVSKIRIPRTALAQKVKSPNSSMLAFYLAQLDADKTKREQQNSIGFQARRIMYHQAKKGIFLNRDQLADLLSCSHRTLTRKLKSDGLSFQMLLDEVRCSMAKQMLYQSSKSTKQVASHIGINNPAVFCRAFKKWSGMTPSEYREQAEN
ncbi:MAG: helix-turn-helix domain-containing protein [Oleispira sp.]|nr:helix-turn-helix domain-containing protein [Oleispira sp.]MBL4880284.1 helix-turn-helix domain-containing protein [Oleispira sp.]